ncbi:sulfane dehydrogenase subunit SoxC [Cnuella takakiae]|uniref:Sulfane dehydrogenase subunit SoxC n=1 Tax=Cnuella takakiae TaxID=1302690 RepID=A0A1M4SXI6_9BACT|nr:sulfite dehydrogenase [Cnuella takakiae]OLY90624.1 sulfite dehydrogenase [Cnuella takakiae]SHE36900.1 sulfane dehydrogenase subunit SoxC [Cnuella takakiae]
MNDVSKNQPNKGRKLSRRHLLGGMAATAAAVLLKQSSGQVIQAGLAKDSLLLQDPTKVLGPLPSQLGDRSPFEQPVRKPSDTSSRTPLQDLYGTITPSDLHFERHHGGIPAIDPHKYELLIHGMVERPTVFTLADLKRFPSFSRIFFLECSGNFRSGKEQLTPQDICGLTSQSEWTGVMLATLFREVGIHPKASWFLAEGSDAAVMTRSIPVSKGMEDGMIAFAQNGEALRPAQGYPARLVLPGWEGNTNVKWIRRIEVSDQPFMTREETSKYTEQVGDKVRQFSFVMDARSVITFPTFPAVVHKGWIEIRGIAWSGRGKIARVEVSTDAGKSWQPAQLQEPVLDKAHTAFRYLWQWDGKATEIMSRAVDDTGYTQPTLEQLKEARGANMGGYHVNSIISWQIKGDGSVLLRPENIR